MGLDANERPCPKCGFQLWFDDGKWYIELDDYRVREEIRYCPKCGTKLIAKIGPSEYKGEGTA